MSFSVRRAHPATTLLAILATLLASGTLAAQQSPPCALQVKPAGGDTGYGRRGALCEGMFVALQSSLLRIQVVSFLKGELRYDLKAAPDKLIANIRLLTRPGDSSVQVIGSVREPNLNWALDAVVDRPDTTLVWDLAPVMKAAELRHDQIGLFGQTSSAQAALADPVFVPLEVKVPHIPPKKGDSLELIIRVPGASGARWKLDGSPSTPNDTLLLIHKDGYFRMTIPKASSAGVVNLAIYWRPRGRLGFNSVPEILKIFLPGA